MERLTVYDELRLRGWSEDEALAIASSDKKSLIYATARLQFELRVLRRLIVNALPARIRRLVYGKQAA